MEDAIEEVVEHLGHELRVVAFPVGGGFLWSYKIVGTGLYKETGGRPSFSRRAALDEGIAAAKEDTEKLFARRGGQDVGG